LFCSCNSFKTDSDPQAKHAELQKLEIDIQRKIASGDKDAALDLLKDLVHPSSESYECTENIRKKWNCYSYDEWWTERREYLQEQILGVSGSIQTNTNDVAYQDTTAKGIESDSLSSTESMISGETVNLPDNYTGLYVFQFSNGNTKFFKIFKNSQGETGVVYQDNVSGNVRVENYAIHAFNEDARELRLESKKSLGSYLDLRFGTDKDSDNGFNLKDSEGTIYSLVGN
jgi:hypothetical protein